MDEILTIHEAAKFLGVSTSTLRNWHKRGKLIPDVNPLTKIRYYKKKQLILFLRQFAPYLTDIDA